MHSGIPRDGIALPPPWVLGFVFVVSACNKKPDDTPPPPPPPAVASPQIPWLDQGEPELAPPAFVCAKDWRAVDAASGVTVCDPWPASGRQDCEGDEAHWPGTDGCVSVSEACDPSGWPTDLPATGVWYVHPDAEGPGSGTLDDPFLSLAAATDVATKGQIIALAMGSHVGQAELADGVSLVGACASATRLTAECSPGDAVVQGADSTIRGLTVHDAACTGIRGIDLAVRSVVVQAVRSNGIEAEGNLVLDQVIVRGTRSDEDDEGPGQGVLVQGPGALTAQHLHVQDNQTTGVRAIGPARLILVEDSVVLDMELSPEGLLGRGFHLSDVDGDVRRTVFEGTADSALFTVDGTLTIEDVDISRTTETGDGWADGITMIRGTDVTISRLWYHDAKGVAVWTQDSDGTVAEDVVVQTIAPSGQAQARGLMVSNGEGTLRRAHLWNIDGDPVYVTLGGRALLEDVQIHGSGLGGGFGVGVVAVEEGSVVAGRLIVEDGLQLGVLASELSEFDGVDVVIRRTPADTSGGLNGRGVVAEGSLVTLSRTLVEQSASTGLLGLAASELRVSDTVVRDLDVPVEDRDGEGISMNRDSHATLERVAIQGTRWGGLHTYQRSTAELTDVSISDVQGDGSGFAGDGLMAWGNSRITGERVQIVGARHVGIRTADDGEITLTGVQVAQTRPMACVDSTCPDNDDAVGVHSGGGPIDLTDFSIVDNGLGAATHGAGQVRLSQGLVQGHPVGTAGNVVLTDVTLLDNDVASEDGGVELSEY